MLLSYLRDDCHKQAVTHIRESRRFKLMYTLEGKTRPTCHTFSMLSPHMVQDHMYLTRSTYINLSHSHQQIWTGLLPQEEELPTQSTAHRLTNPRVRTQLLSHNSQWSSGEKSSFCWPSTTRLTGPISPVCDRYVQYLLTGPTHRSLTDTGGDYNLGGAGLPHITPRPSQLAVSTFP
jgi:hypothetical protein